MAIVASLDIVMRAQTDQAGSKLLKFVDVIGRVKNALIGAAAAWLSFEGAMRAFQSIKAGFERLDKLVETGEKLGLTANELYAVGNAAKLSGSDIESVAKALGKMQMTIGKAALRGEQGIFEKLRLDFRALLNMSPAQQFIEISEAITKLGSSEERAAAAQAVFGNSARDIINLMSDARGKIQSASDAIREMGGELSALDVARVSVAADAWDMLGQRINIAWEYLAKRFSPAIGIAADFLSRLVAIAAQFAKLIVNAFDSGTVRAAAFIGIMLGLLIVLPMVTKLIGALSAALTLLAGRAAVVNALLGPKGWLYILAAVAGAAVALKMIEADMDAFNAKVDKQLTFKPITLIPDFDELHPELEKLDKKIVTLRVNPQYLEQGSPEEVTRRLAVDLKVEKDVQKQQLDAQQDSNQILQDILEEIKKQTDQITGDADL